ncbi:MAG: cobalt ECF transporter T component CbiQ [Candidatus Omnitrophota bacterium]
MSKRHSHFIERSIMGILSFLKESVFADEFSGRRGFLQARDPRLKTVGFFLLLFLVLLTKSLPVLATMYVVCLVLASVSSVRLGFFLKRTWFFIPFFALCIAVPALFETFTPGEPLFVVRIFSLSAVVTRQGMASAAFFFLRVLTSVSLAALLALTTKHATLLKVLRLFGVPQVFVMTMGMCTRYIYLLLELIEHTYVAIRSRVGHVVATGPGQRVVAWNMANFWHRSFELQTQVYQAMCSRGYRGEPQIFEVFRATSKDWLWLVGVAALFLVMLWKT